MNTQCEHKTVKCLNQYEFIRKYVCENCNEIMMCSCDEEYGRRFLAHQLDMGCVLETQERVPVTIGFQDKICPECRGHKPIPAPKAPMRGATNKIKRYYWREIHFAVTKHFYDKHPELNPSEFLIYHQDFTEELKIIEKDVLEKIKILHREKPKYQYSEMSQSEVVAMTDTEVILVNAEHVKQEGKVRIRDADSVLFVETFASNYFRKTGYKVMESESTPFHVLFGVFMYLLIQQPEDDSIRVVRFGSRFDSDNKVIREGSISTLLPVDFGTSGYYQRQKDKIKLHLDELDDFQRLFDYWFEPSANFRQYLWAHRSRDIAKARRVLSIIGASHLKKILEYMVMDYWQNFCGWPDLLVYNDDEFFFVEVKSSGDILSEDQKRWLQGNCTYMGFETKLFKVGKTKA